MDINSLWIVYNNWHRYYDPKLGRYLTTDPIGINGRDLNLYGYVRNNPINWVDPLGLVINWNGYIVTNPNVRNALIRLDKALPNARIEVTAGDRYRDQSGNIRDSNTDAISERSATNSQHLYGDAVDFEVFDISLSEEAVKKYFDYAYWNTNYPGRGVFHGDMRNSAGCPGTKLPTERFGSQQ